MKPKRITAFLLSVAMTISLLPTFTLTASADETPTTTTEKNIALGTSALKGAQQSNVWFGNYPQQYLGKSSESYTPVGEEWVDYLSQYKWDNYIYFAIEPVKWRVLDASYNYDGNGSKGLFLVSDKTVDAMPYHMDNAKVSWNNSYICEWLNGEKNGIFYNGRGMTMGNTITHGFFGSAFSEKEQNAIKQNANSSSKIFLLSKAEAEKYFTTEGSRITYLTEYTKDGGSRYDTDYILDGYDTSYWWLRDSSSSGTWLVTNQGAFLSFNTTKTGCTVRPAFNMDADSVLLTTPAENGKSAASGLQKTTEYTGTDYKLTLMDSNHGFKITNTSKSVTTDAGNQVSFTYENATVGDNEYISAILTAENSNDILYYGQVANVESEDGTVTITLPADIAKGKYTLKLFNERINGDKKTDYSSAFSDIALTIMLEGSGTETKPYLINDLNELEYFRDKVNAGNTFAGKYIKLNTDIDLSEKYGAEKASWTPIGNVLADETQEAGYKKYSFQGTFDGNGKKISGLYIQNTDSTSPWDKLYKGLFGIVENGTLMNLAVAGTITADKMSYVGGICAFAKNSTIEKCINECNITAKVNGGGIVGFTSDTVLIKGCVNDGDVTVNNSNVGGIVGYASAQTTVSNCANYKAMVVNSISGGDSAGGIVGYVNVKGENAARIENCYSTGTAKASRYAGGIVGYDNFDNVKNCYYINTDLIEYTNSNGTSKSDESFTNGEIAYLLQNGQTTQVWGQSLSGDKKDASPILTSDKKVYKITFLTTEKNTESDPYAVRYANKNFDEASFPSAPDGEYEYLWSITNSVNGEMFGKNTVITKDMTVYGVKKESTEASNKSDKITLIKNEEIATPIDLSDYVQNKSGNATKNFAFYLEDENTLPDGLEFSESIGKIIGTPTKTGTYTVKFNVANNSGISLMSIESANGVDVLIITIDVYFEGEGTETKPFLINDLNELEYFRDKVNSGTSYEGKYVKLTDNIDMTGFYGADVNDTGKSWEPIGTPENPFNGTFDGNGKTISGLYIRATDNNQGLFGVVTGGTVKDFTVKGNISVSATADKNVETIGAAAGLVYNGATVDKITSYVNISDTGMTANNNNRHIGGIVGYLGKTNTDKASYIKNSCNYGNITMQSCQSAAGIVGVSVYNNEISNCFNRGNITFSGDASKHIGGIAGDANEGVTVKYCINYGDVASKGSDCIGGVVAYANVSTRIENCANVGTVTCTNKNGGFIGGVLGYINNNGFGALANCYNYGNIISASGNSNHPDAVVGWCRNTTVSMFKNNYWRTGSCSAVSNTKTIPDAYEKTDDDFKSGEIAYLLQKNQTADVWGQNIGTDKYPTFSDAKVYEDEYNSEKLYRNEIDGNKILLLGADKKSATVVINTVGTHIIVFADYEDKRLANVEAFEVTVAKPQAVRVTSDKNFTLGTGDKIMLWDNFVNLIPMCEAYEVK